MPVLSGSVVRSVHQAKPSLLAAELLKELTEELTEELLEELTEELLLATLESELIDLTEDFAPPPLEPPPPPQALRLNKAIGKNRARKACLKLFILGSRLLSWC